MANANTIQEALNKGAIWDLDGEEDLATWQGSLIKKVQTCGGLAYEMHRHGDWYTAIHKHHPHDANLPYWYLGRLPASFKEPLTAFPRHDPMDDIVSLDDVI